MQTTLRNATLNDLAALLQQQQASKVDVVVRGSHLKSEDGRLLVPGVESQLTDDGVTAVPGWLTPTTRCDETIAAKFGIPIKYLRTVRDSELFVPGNDSLIGAPLIDAMLNAHFAADDRKLLVRGFKGEDGNGIARALLSDQFKAIDHLDSLMAVLDGAKSASASVEVLKIDLSERFMRVRFIAPEITALAPKLLKGYRPPEGTHPFGTVDGKPVVFAGIDASNSETGGGAFSMTPVIIFQWCTNGATRTKEAMRVTHLGAKMEEGIVKWSDETYAKNIALIGSMARDAVTTFLDTEYVERVINEAEAHSDVRIERPDEAIKIIAQKMAYTETERETLLAHFIEGGQVTAGGVFNAVTSMAQMVEDPDRAAEIEATAFDALVLAAR